MPDIVNGREVEYLFVNLTPTGYVIEYSERFDIVTAHMSVIQQRLRENGFQCQVFKDLEHKIIVITYKEKKNIIPILYTLNIDDRNYEVNEEFKEIIIDI